MIDVSNISATMNKDRQSCDWIRVTRNTWNPSSFLFLSGFLELELPPFISLKKIRNTKVIELLNTLRLEYLWVKHRVRTCNTVKNGRKISPFTSFRKLSNQSIQIVTVFMSHHFMHILSTVCFAHLQLSYSRTIEFSKWQSKIQIVIWQGLCYRVSTRRWQTV